MTKVHILTEGFVAPNVRAIFYPLVRHRRALAAHGIEWRAITDRRAADLCDCDVLLVESNIHGKKWNTNEAGILDEIAGYGERAGRVIYLDTADSTALLHPEVLPVVDFYAKAQLLRDRDAYLERHYGNRIFTDYVHRAFGVVDTAPASSRPVAERALLGKLRLSWNSGLADYSAAGRYLSELYARLPWPALLRAPGSWTAPSAQRSHDVSCRMSTNYARATVAWQRAEAQKRLTRWAPASRVSHRRYVTELQTSKIVVSPFGWGELNYKDFETFIAGSLLLKPDMRHVDTWPDLYRDGETMVAYAWDAADLEAKVEAILDNNSEYVAIAQAGQDTYRRHVSDPDAAQLFCRRMRDMIAAEAAPVPMQDYPGAATARP